MKGAESVKTIPLKFSKTKKERYIVPKTVQQAIPIQSIYKDGIFQSGRIYSKTFRFEDINYQIAGEAEQEMIFHKYSAILNSFEADGIVQFTIRNHRRSSKELAENVLIPQKADGLNKYRQEYNTMLKDHAYEGNGIVQERYITVTSSHAEVNMARGQFHRIGTNIAKGLKEIGSISTPLDGKERLRIFHDFYRPGEEAIYDFDFQEHLRLGHDFRDYVCPDSMEKNKDFLKIGEKFCRVLFIKKFPSFNSDALVQKLCDFDRDMMLSITSIPMSTEKAMHMAEQRLMGVETDITNWQQKQNQRNNFSAVIPFQKEQKRQECREYLNDLTNRDQRIFITTITILHTADTLEELNHDTDTLRSIAQDKMCQIAPLTFQQLDGLNTTLPLGIHRIHADRTMTTEALASFMPFHAQEVNHFCGIYYGQNVVSNNMILVDRLLLQNANSFILGVAGAGKSFIAKCEMVALSLRTNADIIVIDPEREYHRLVKQFGGEIVNVSAYSDNHINALELCPAHDESVEKAIRRKQEFILSLCEEIIGEDAIGPKEKSLIDRCSGNIYRSYVKEKKHDKCFPMPTLKDLYEELKAQPETLGKELALEIELYATGSMNTFAQDTNVDVHSKFICYDIHELGRDLMTVGMLVVLDNIMNRISQNREDGKKTYIFIDEIYLLFLHNYSFDFLYKLWKRARKYGGCCTGMTQNVEDVLRTENARALIGNSEFLIMLNQAPSDRSELAELLSIPDNQLSYITGAKTGHGLLKVGSSLVPFANEFPKDTELYRLMTSKQDEVFQQKQEKAAG